MARQSEIDKRIAELQAEINTKQEAIAVLRSVQKRNAPKVRPVKRKGYPAGMVVGESSAADPQPSGRTTA